MQLFPAQRAFWEWSMTCCVCQALPGHCRAECFLGLSQTTGRMDRLLDVLKMCWNCQDQRAVISGSVPSGQPVMDGICQGLIIFISYPGNEAEQSLSKFVD